MEETMSSELSILALYGLWIVVVILIQVLAAIGQVELAKSRDNMPELEGIAARLDRAQINSIVAMALFAPAILLLNIKGISTSGTLLAAQVFLIARIAHSVVYTAGTPWVRTLVWIVGFLATAYLYLLANT
jgi:uncharacterized MAPEG superfamily protein